MRDLIKSAFSFSWVMTLFGLRQAGGVLAPGAPKQPPQDSASAAFDAVAAAAGGQLQGPLRGIFEGVDKLQRGLVDQAFSLLPAMTGAGGAAASPAAGAARARSGRLDASRFIVLGEGLAAGIGHFSLSEDLQSQSFPAQLARQMGVAFNQPLLQAPGAGNVPGFAARPIIVPMAPQTTVRKDFPPAPPAQWLSNLAVPGFTLADALGRRPAPPLIRRDDSTQTLTNLILGLPALLGSGTDELPTQLELARQARATFTLVVLGYGEAAAAAVAGDAGRLPDAGSFQADFAQLFAGLKESGGQVVAATIPDPLDSAYVSTLAQAARLVHTEPAFLAEVYELAADDLLTVSGLVEVGFQFTAHDIGKTLPAGSVLAAGTARSISAGVDRLNEQLRAAAGAQDLPVYDLHGFFRRARQEGIAVGSRRLTADFLGGLYLLNGLYPGATAHALIANELLDFLAQRLGASFGRIDAAAVLAGDPLGMVTFPSGPNATEEFRRPFTLADFPPPPPGGPPPQPWPLEHPVGIGLPEPQKLAQPLVLPPGLEQELPLERHESYVCDALRALSCPDDPPGPGGLPPLGLCGNLMFGGLCMTGSYLDGIVRVKFSPPQNGVSHFEVSLPQGLPGGDTILSAPLFYKLPALLYLVRDFPGLVSAGDLDLATGMVSNVQFYFIFFNTALAALKSVNPNLPSVPIQCPGPYGAAAVRFDQRPDGLLDLTFEGSAFLPLGTKLGPDPVRWPLPFSNSQLQCVGFPAPASSLHPHIRLSTKAAETSAKAGAAPKVQLNSVQELTCFSHNSPFGDHFDLDIPELGGPATGRSHLVGRLLVQVGYSLVSGYAAPIAIFSLPPGGFLSTQPPNPYAKVGAAMGLLGHDEQLKFPKQTYSLNDVFLADDPFDIAVSAIQLGSGRLIGDLLYRGFIGQDVIFALGQLEPRTPKSSFGFRGPASLVRDASGELHFRFEGEVLIPYPAGFKFPQPDLRNTFVVRANSRLDPFLWLDAIESAAAGSILKRGGEQNVVASTGAVFSYKYSIPSDPVRDQAAFEYTNHTQGSSFQMRGLAWVSFLKSHSGAARRGEVDTVTFTGYGSWSQDPGPAPHVATVQISTSRKAPYVSIQIDGGETSNVNTKPANMEDARP
ncbi:MAG TPA: hypothetical protein VHR45_19555 [Thermoanaerobaculia bacterium]|nr:hypothetical protein [Thermoanaerobaculia bacterium]